MYSFTYVLISTPVYMNIFEYVQKMQCIQVWHRSVVSHRAQHANRGPYTLLDLQTIIILSLLFVTGLTGTLPPSWSSLSQLQLLDVSGHRLNGTLPNSWQSFPELRDLKLSNNNLTGTLPPYWGHLTQLQTMDLSGNNLNGTVPTS